MSIDLAKGTYLNVADAAAYIGVTTGRIRQLIRDEQLEAIRIDNRTYLINESALKPLVQASKVGRPRVASQKN